MYERILIPTDGSGGANRGVEHGLEMARQYGATVHVLYVVDERYHATPALSSEDLYLEQCEDRGHEIVEEVVERAAEAGLDTESACVRGIPHEEIREYAGDHDVDIIVMGLHGASQVERPHIGSTTDRVLRSTRIPVLPV